MSKGKRRTRSPHPGVVLKRRTWKSGRHSWFARWTDPDTGKVVDTNLSKLGLSTHESRRDWALSRSKSLNERRAALASGAPARTHTELEKAELDYFASQTRLSSSTIRTYREGIDRFMAWSSAAGIRITEDLSPARVARFREHLSNEPRRQALSGAPRGSWAPSAAQRSPYTVNRDLCSIRAMLNSWRRLGLVPLLDRDAIADSLRPLPEPRPRPSPLKLTEVSELLTACLDHDGGAARVFPGFQDSGPGRARAPVSITPFVLFVLLTGCRRGEALGLRWDDIDFEARSGAGEIVLQATATKTRHERAIDLSIAPSLRTMLMLLRLRSGGRTNVFGGDGPLSEDRVVTARKRLMKSHGAPTFTWQRLRQTTGSYLTNAPGIFDAASAFRSARQLGHSVTVAERHYVGILDVDRDAKTLEDAMGIRVQVAQILHGEREVPSPIHESAR